MKSDQERGPIGRWLRAERLSRGWTPEDVVAHLEEPAVPSTVRAFESGNRNPSSTMVAAFVRLYGTEPQDEVPSLSADARAIVAAINELRDELRAHRGEHASQEPVLGADGSPADPD